MGRKLAPGVRKSTPVWDTEGFEYLATLRVEDSGRISAYLVNPEGDDWGKFVFPTLKMASEFYKEAVRDANTVGGAWYFYLGSRRDPKRS